MKLFVSICITLLFASNLFAQEKPVTAETSFFGTAQPVVKELPLPEYPEISKAVGFGGRISVSVTLDEKGNVISTENADGPYPICSSVTIPKVTALRDAALAAARAARFTMPDQTTGNTQGRIIYEFISDQKLVPSGEPVNGFRVVSSSNNVPDSDTGATLDKDNGGTTAVKATQLPKTVSGGVLNGKAMDLAKPTYPAAAKAVRAGGSVAVQVLIDEDGSAYSASAVSGHPLLRRASEIAACGSRFSPTLLSGQPVKVSGVIMYNFIP